MKAVIEVTGEKVTLAQVVQVATRNFEKLSIADVARVKIQKSRSYIEARIASGEVMYGVNTGFGAFSSVRISDSQIEDLQRNLIRSHSAGIGEPFTIEETRAIMFLRANTLSRGHSGVRVEVVEKILEFLQKDLIPVVPSQGSVGASGDLAPLSHLALALIGEGEVWHEGHPTSAKIVLAKHKVEPLTLKAKEGLSLINGCQVMTAVGLLQIARAQDLVCLADLSAAMTLEATRGSRKAYNALIAPTRPHPGEASTAINLRTILGETSEIGGSHTGCHKVQDAYSLRCVPAVHGAVKNTLTQSLKTLEIEANSSTDNPLVFADENQVLSCGNFHGEPVAFAMDFLGIAMSSLGNISERRIAKLIDPNFSELPAFLTPEGGLNSGHMIVQVAAASLVSENKILSHPASVDSIPTSSDKEDHVSMGTIAARKLKKILDNVSQIIAMEFLSASQGLDLLRPLKSSPVIEAIHQLIRSEVPFAKEDRVFSQDTKKIHQLIENRKIIDSLEKHTGGLKWQAE